MTNVYLQGIRCLINSLDRNCGSAQSPTSISSAGSSFIMPSYLHPRSRWTMSLFVTTLGVSFLVVGMPHLLPCPVPPRALADGEMDTTEDGRRRRRRRYVDRDGIPLPAAEQQRIREEEARARARECPVPKPSGLIGHLLGFDQQAEERPIVRIEPLRRRGNDVDS